MGASYAKAVDGHVDGGHWANQLDGREKRTGAEGAIGLQPELAREELALD